MTRNLLPFGILAGVIFFATVYGLATSVPGYSHLSQTVSEIGKIGSAVETPFKIGMLTVNLCVILFAVGLFGFARSAGLSTVPVYLVLFYGLADIGTNVFPSPHSLHNWFGLSLTLGYLAPLVTSIAWRRFTNVRSIATVSGFIATLIFVSIFLNISPAFNRDLYPLEFYGAVQRSIFVLFYGWCAYLAARTWRIAGQIPNNH
jgi:hypothetical membrane protein